MLEATFISNIVVWLHNKKKVKKMGYKRDAYTGGIATIFTIFVFWITFILVMANIP